MNDALKYREELDAANRTYDSTLDAIHNDAIHSILNSVLSLNRRGYSFSISFFADYITIFKDGDDSNEGNYIRAGGSVAIHTVGEAIDVLFQLEAIENNHDMLDSENYFEEEDISDVETV